MDLASGLVWERVLQHCCVSILTGGAHCSALAHLFRLGSQEVKVSMLDFLCLLPPELSWARLRLLAGW